MKTDGGVPVWRQALQTRCGTGPPHTVGGEWNHMRVPAGLRQRGRTTPSMRTVACVAGLAIAIVQATLCATPADAQTTGTPTTMWSFLGVPNPFGMNAAAQQSANPAIQAAAKAKAAKHEICKKKAALKYLAGLGCTPEHPEVMPALMAAMDDPDELVRYEAVKAVLQTAEVCQSGDQKKETRKTKGLCETCKDWKKACEKEFCDALDRLCGKAPPKEHKHKLKQAMKSMLGGECEDPTKEDCPCADRRGSCCSPEMREKLMKLAYGRDDMGCFLEPSKRVRDLAEQAFNACNACACGCEGTMGTESGMDNVVREMPPVDDRETRPSDAIPLPLGGPCYEDRLVMPPQMDDREMVPTPAPMAEPEAIPAPAAAALLPGTQSVLVRAPETAESRSIAAARGAPVWQPLDPATPFAEADAAAVPGFLAGMERRQPSTRIAGQSVTGALDRRHAESRVALVPAAGARNLPQPIVSPEGRRRLSARQPATGSSAAGVASLWVPLGPQAFMASAADLPLPYDWASPPPADPLDVVRRLTGWGLQPLMDAVSPPAVSPPVPPDHRATPSTARILVPPPASQPRPSGVAEPDWLRLLSLACLASALAIAIFGWPRATQAASNRPEAGSRVMMRTPGAHRHPDRETR